MYKFFYLFLVGGFVSLAILIYAIVSTYPAIKATGILSGAIPAVVFFYLAYKVWHEKNDSELM
jgi:hypothetical protein